MTYFNMCKVKNIKCLIKDLPILLDTKFCSIKCYGFFSVISQLLLSISRIRF